MGSIATTEARGLFTKALVDVYRERTRPTSFLRSFFPTVEKFTKHVSIEVRRGKEKVAVDVIRGTEGNRNTFSRSTEKIFEPPYYREYTDNTQLDLYDTAMGSERIDAGMFTELTAEIAEKYGEMQDKIERAYELQCKEVLHTGIVTLNSGDNIDFKRKAGSLVDLGAPNYWDDAGVDPIPTIEAGCNFLRQVGKAAGGVFNMILGSKALNSLLNNDAIQTRADVRNYQLDAIRAPQRNSVGASPHGFVSAGSYTVIIWTYPEFYDNESDVSTPWITQDTMILLPEAPRFNLVFAAVPQLMGQPPRRGAYLLSDYMDPRNDSHVFDIKSAGIAIPTAVDQIYTAKVTN